jgi:hypothetical protein
MKTLTQILADNQGANDLGKLIVKARQLQYLNEMFRHFIASDLAKNCKVGALKDEQLTVIVSNSSWATRLRYAIPDIIKNLNTQAEFKDVKKIRYVINFEEGKLPARKRKKMFRSAEHAKLWAETLKQLGVSK